MMLRPRLLITQSVMTTVHEAISEVVIVNLTIIATQHQLPDVAGDGIAAEAYAAIRKASVHPTEMPAAGLRLPVGPVVRRVVVGTAHPLTRAELFGPVQLAVFDIVREWFPVIGSRAVPYARIGGGNAGAGQSHGPGASPVPLLHADADFVEQDRVGGAVLLGQLAERRTPVNAHDPTLLRFAR